MFMYEYITIYLNALIYMYALSMKLKNTYLPMSMISANVFKSNLLILPKSRNNSWLLSLTLTTKDYSSKS